MTSSEKKSVPDTAITRGEVMTMINRVLCRMPENAEDLLGEMTVWSDNQPSDWFYLAVQEATNSHDYVQKSDNVYEHWTAITATPNWTKYE